MLQFLEGGRSRHARCVTYDLRRSCSGSTRKISGACVRCCAAGN
jgi:hypothetical protein